MDFFSGARGSNLQNWPKTEAAQTKKGNVRRGGWSSYDAILYIAIDLKMFLFDSNHDEF